MIAFGVPLSWYRSNNAAKGLLFAGKLEQLKRAGTNYMPVQNSCEKARRASYRPRPWSSACLDMPRRAQAPTRKRGAMLENSPAMVAAVCFLS
jgi:hypothetical protein